MLSKKKKVQHLILIWSDLPSDLLFTIFKKLKERDARLICLAVCESWKLVIENQYPQLKPYFPFI